MTYQIYKIKILIVDDMKPMLALSKAFLNALGFQNIYTAEDGDEGFDALIKYKPDLVITDWVMGQADGLEFTEKIRRDKHVPDPFVPIIMMTGFSSRLRAETALDAGVTEFLVKPFTAIDLQMCIKKIFKNPLEFASKAEFISRNRLIKNTIAPIMHHCTIEEIESSSTADLTEWDSAIEILSS